MTAATLLLDPHLLQRRDLTVDDLTGLPEDLRYELIEGRLVLTPHAKPTHQLISKQVSDAIDEHCPDDFFSNIEQAILVGPQTELRPDVVVMSETAPETSPIPVGDVLLVVEVVSPSSEVIDRERKFKQYAEAGIPHYWIIDPLGERVTFTQFSLQVPGVYAQVLHTDRLVTVDRPWEVTLDLPALTRRRDRRRANARPHG